jgi:hypothetical protein
LTYNNPLSVLFIYQSINNKLKKYATIFYITVNN